MRYYEERDGKRYGKMELVGKGMKASEPRRSRWIWLVAGVLVVVGYFLK